MSYESQGKKTSLMSAFMSVLFAAFGVQTRKNHEDDFEQGSPAMFIIAGVIFTVLFVLVLFVIVKVVIANST